jgi:hypothetical protein
MQWGLSDVERLKFLAVLSDEHHYLMTAYMSIVPWVKARRVYEAKIAAVLSPSPLAAGAELPEYLGVRSAPVHCRDEYPTPKNGNQFFAVYPVSCMYAASFSCMGRVVPSSLVLYATVQGDDLSLTANEFASKWGLSDLGRKKFLFRLKDEHDHLFQYSSVLDWVRIRKLHEAAGTPTGMTPLGPPFRRW